MPKNQHGLNHAQQVFADCYRSHPEYKGNAKASYMYAYPKCAEKSAEVNGCKLLRNPKIEAYLQSKQEEAEKAADVTQERILQELCSQAFFDPADFYDQDGNLKLIHDIPEDARRALAGIEAVAEGGGDDESGPVTTVKVKYVAKVPALQLLMRYMGMLKDKVEHSGEIKGAGVLVLPEGQSLEEWQKGSRK